jgi:hypothetical protein
VDSIYLDLESPGDRAKLQEIEKFLHDPAGWSKAHGGAAEAAE